MYSLDECEYLNELVNKGQMYPMKQAGDWVYIGFENGCHRIEYLNSHNILNIPELNWEYFRNDCAEASAVTLTFIEGS